MAHAVLRRHTLDGRFPTIGAWVNYGLGTLNDNLPQFITMGPRFLKKMRITSARLSPWR